MLSWSGAHLSLGNQPIGWRALNTSAPTLRPQTTSVPGASSGKGGRRRTQPRTRGAPGCSRTELRRRNDAVFMGNRGYSRVRAVSRATDLPPSLLRLVTKRGLRSQTREPWPQKTWDSHCVSGRGSTRPLPEETLHSRVLLRVVMEAVPLSLGRPALSPESGAAQCGH